MKAPIYTLLWSLVLVPPLDAVAQTGTAGGAGPAAEQQRAAPSDKALAMVPQSAPQSTPESPLPQAVPQAAGPANICRELLAFLRSKAASPQPPTTAGQPGPNPGSSAAGTSVQASGQPAPVPQAQAAFAPNSETLEQATAMANANDLPRCQQIARGMRRAGIDMPPGLLALAALKPDLLGAASPAGASPPSISPPGTK